MSGCSYHSERHGLWACTGCQKHYCSECVPGGLANFDDAPTCPLCNSPLRYQGRDLDTQSLGQIFGRFWQYPVQLFPLLLVLLVALGAPLLLHGALLSIVTITLIASLYLHYGLSICQEMAAGRWLAPGFSAQPGETRQPLLFKQLMIYGVLLGLIWLAGRNQQSLGLSLALLLPLLIPASTMILTVTGRLLPALNPLDIARLIRKLKASYLLFWLLVLPAFCVPSLLIGSDRELWITTQSSPVLMAVTLLLLFYLGMVVHAMMGYTIYARRYELGLEQEQERGTNLPQEQYEIKKALGTSYLLVREQKSSVAKAVLSDAIKRYPLSPELRLRMHAILLNLSDEEGIVAHAEQCYELFSKVHLLHKLVPLYEALQRRNTLYHPSDPKIVEEFARLYLRREEYAKVIRLLQNITEWAADQYNYPTLLLLLAKAQFECGTGLKAAVGLFLQISHLAPGSKEAQEAEGLLETALSFDPALKLIVDRVSPQTRLQALSPIGQEERVIGLDLSHAFDEAEPEPVADLHKRVHHQKAVEPASAEQRLPAMKQKLTLAPHEDKALDEAMRLELLELELEKEKRGDGDDPDELLRRARASDEWKLL